MAANYNLAINTQYRHSNSSSGKKKGILMGAISVVLYHLRFLIGG